MGPSGPSHRQMPSNRLCLPMDIPPNPWATTQSMEKQANSTSFHQCSTIGGHTIRVLSLTYGLSPLLFCVHILVNPRFFSVKMTTVELSICRLLKLRLRSLYRLSLFKLRYDIQLHNISSSSTRVKQSNDSDRVV